MFEGYDDEKYILYDEIIINYRVSFYPLIEIEINFLSRVFDSNSYYLAEFVILFL